MNQLTLADLSAAVAGKYAAVRRTTVLEALGEKIFPPTYEGGEYAKEPRVVAVDNGQTRTVTHRNGFVCGALQGPILRVDYLYCTNLAGPITYGSEEKESKGYGFSFCRFTW